MIATETLAAFLPFWKDLTEDEQKQLQAAAYMESLPKGTELHRDTERCRGLSLVVQGQIRVSMVSDDMTKELTLFRMQPGEVCIFSAYCLLDNITFETIIKVAEPSDIIFLPSYAFLPIKEKNLHVQLYLAQTANERFSDAMWTMQQILFCSVDQRLAAFLWDEYTKTGSRVVTYTHQEIANMIGSAREVVTRMLKVFSTQGAVTLNRGYIELNDLKRLQGISHKPA